MSARTVMLSGRRAALRDMTDTWVVTRAATPVLNESTGQYTTPTPSTIYSGPAKLQSFESYEQSPTVAGHTYAVMRKHLHLPFTSASVLVAVDDVATCSASASNPTLVGTKVRIAGGMDKTFATAVRLPVAEILA